MDWTALFLSLELAALTVIVLLPVAVLGGRWLAYSRRRGKGWVEAALTLPLVLPPTVLGFYLLQAFGAGSWIGQTSVALFGQPLVFSFTGLVVASVLINLPFALQPAQRGFEAVGRDLREAAALCGLSPWQRLWRVELPLAWPGVITGLVLSFAHTLGEFGVVLMVGGSIPGQTRTIAIAIYDRVQAFDTRGAALMSATLLGLSLAAVMLSYALSRRIGRRLS